MVLIYTGLADAMPLIACEFISPECYVLWYLYDERWEKLDDGFNKHYQQLNDKERWSEHAHVKKSAGQQHLYSNIIKLCVIY